MGVLQTPRRHPPESLSGNAHCVWRGGQFEERYLCMVPPHLLGYTDEQVKELPLRRVSQIELMGRLDDVDLEKDVKPIAHRLMLEEVYPKFDPKMHTKASPDFEGNSNCFLKHFELLLSYPDMTEQLPDVKPCIITEIRSCEILKKSPSPHLAKYLGCKVQGDFVTGIHYARYKELDEIPQPWDVVKYIGDTRKGIEHLHSLGLCHNDINPFNIMVRDDGAAVVIDFDACRPIGEKLVKYGSEGFFKGRPEYSDVDNYWYGLEKTELYLYKERDGHSS